MTGQILIGEVKLQSPTGYKSPHSREYQARVVMNHCDWASIHDEEAWGGSIPQLAELCNWFEQARPGITRLAKGLHRTDDDVQRALDAGAHYVLVYDRITADKYIDQCLFEPGSYRRLCEWNNLGLPKVVWNQRDLNNLRQETWKREQFATIRDEYIGWLCQASGIKTVKDVHPKADAVLVGTNLLSYLESKLNDLQTSRAD